MKGILSGVVLFSAAVAFAGRGFWSENGPLGASVTAIAASRDGNVLYLGTQLSHVFRSTNGGALWEEVSQIPGQGSYYSPISIAIDPTNPDIVFAAEKGVGIFKTTDGGASWTPMTSGFASPPSVCGDVAACSPNIIAIDPSNANTVMAGTVSGLFRSTDGGENWSILEPDGYPSDVVQAIVFDPSDSEIIYAGESSGLYKTTDGGGTWSPENGGLIEPNVVGLAIDPTDSSILYAIDSSRGLFRISGGGASWSRISGPFNSLAILAVMIDPTDDATLFALLPYAIYLSPDAGRTWKEVGTASGDFDRFQALLAVGSNPMLFAGKGSGLFESVDRGATWIQRNQGIEEASVSSIALGPGIQPVVYAAVTTGLETLGWISSSSDGWAQLQGTIGGPAKSVVIDPLDPMKLYASSGGDFLRSTDSGRTWERTPGSETFNFGWLAVQSTTPDTIYSIPQLEDDGSILRSKDGGNTWVSFPFPFGVSTNPLLPVLISGMVVDPKRDGRVYVVGVFGIARTTDGCQTWKKIGDPQFLSLAVDPQTTLTLYAGSPSGLSKSIDGGDTWLTLTSSLGLVGALAVDPADSRVLYAATQAGFEASHDGGITWANLSVGLSFAEVLTVAVDSSGERLYAGTFHGVYEYDVPPIIIPIPLAPRPSVTRRVP